MLLASRSRASILGRLSTVTVSAHGLPSHWLNSWAAAESSWLLQARSRIMPPLSTTSVRSAAAAIRLVAESLLRSGHPPVSVNGLSTFGQQRQQVISLLYGLPAVDGHRVCADAGYPLGVFCKDSAADQYANTAIARFAADSVNIIGKHLKTAFTAHRQAD